MRKWNQLAAALIVAATAGTALAADENVTGQWTAPISLPLVPSSGSVLPNGKLLLWAADGQFYFGRGGNIAYTVLVDPQTQAQQPMTATAGQNMFCTGTTNLADGRILVNGGGQSEVSSIYDPANNSFTRVQDMNVPRGYNANTILSDGSVFTFGGSWSGPGTQVNKIGEVWNESSGWRALPNVTTTSIPAELPVNWASDSHFWLLPTGNGKVLYAGPHPDMKWITTGGNGTMSEAGARGDDAVALNGSTVMYEAGKILKTGGAAAYNFVPASAASYLIDTTQGAEVTKLSAMSYTRGFHNSVVMPDGKVLVVGGQSFAVAFSDSYSVLPAEIWNPVTKTFSVVAPISVPRNYHSIALLLPDGRILSGGGGLCDCSADHPNYQIYSPPYLFDADGNAASRPSITAAPAEMPYGGTVQVTTDRAVTSFAMIRVNSVTHSVNHDQRRISLTFNQTAAGEYTLDVPSNSGYLLPGYWMLFAIDSAGVPSVSKMVHVQANTIARMVSPDPIGTRVGDAILVQPDVTALMPGVTYGGSGLPPGAGVNPATGEISGAAATAGSYLGQLTASDGIRTVSVDLAFNVEAGANDSPVLVKPANQVSSVGATVNLAVSASDPEGGVLTFSASGLPQGLDINATTGAISGTITAPGNYAPSVMASDGGLSDTEIFAWSVADTVPQVTSLPVSPRLAGSNVTYAPAIANPTGVTYSWNFGDGSAATAFATPAGIDHVFASPGIYAVSLAMKNASGSQFVYRFDQAVHSPPAAGASASSSSGLAFETRVGAAPRLWVANRDNGSVAVIDLSSNSRVAEIATGSDPVTVARHPDGTIWVVNRGSATISFINPVTLTVTKTVTLPRASRPFGLAFAGAADNAFVALEAAEKVIEISSAGQLLGSTAAGRAPRHVARNGDGSHLYVSSFITPELPGESTARVSTTGSAGQPVGGEVWDFTTDRILQRKMILKHSSRSDTEVSARGIPNYLGAAAVSPDGLSLWVPSKQDNIKRGVLRDGQGLNFQNSVRAIVSRINLATGLETLASRIDVDNSGIVSAIAFHPTGAYLFAALQTSREVAVLDPALKRELFRFDVGRAPSALTLAPDGLTLYVSNFMDRSVSVIDLTALVTTGQKAVTVTATVPTIAAEKLAPSVLAGKRFFYDAADLRLARDGYLSCAVCHDSGGGDGRVWDFTGFGEGLRNTISLEGHGGMAQGFLHWSANFDELQDFEGQIRSFAGGTGLMSTTDFNAGDRANPLGATKAGFSADLDALAAYLSSLSTVPPSPYRNANGKMSAKAQAGQAVFAAQGCATCHGGAQMTISGNASQLKDVGTIKGSSGTRLGQPLSGLDVPTLFGLWATAPYLHNGSKPLAAAIRAHQNVSIGNADLANLSRYLYEIEPGP